MSSLHHQRGNTLKVRKMVQMGEPDYTNDDVDIVEFTEKCMYSDVEVKAQIQFTLDKEEGTFQATYLSYNKVPQPTLMLAGVLNSVFESYSDDLDANELPTT